MSIEATIQTASEPAADCTGWFGGRIPRMQPTAQTGLARAERLLLPMGWSATDGNRDHSRRRRNPMELSPPNKEVSGPPAAGSRTETKPRTGGSLD